MTQELIDLRTSILEGRYTELAEYLSQLPGGGNWINRRK
jgi:hypothetical protein